MFIKLLSPFTLIFLFGCSHQFYDYDGKRYRIYQGLEGARNKSEVYAIDLSNNSLNHVPKGIVDFKQLILLDLNNNKITALTDEICMLQNLKILSLNNNHFENVPLCVYEMTQLEVLTLFGCKAKISRDGFAKLINLKILGIGGNQFNDDDLIYLRTHLPNCKIITSVD